MGDQITERPPEEELPSSCSKLYARSPDIRSLKAAKLEEAFKKWSQINFVVDKPGRRGVTYCFLHLRDPNDAEKLIADLNGRVLKNVPLELTRCTEGQLKIRKSPRTGPASMKEPAVAYKPIQGLENGPQPPLPYIADLRQKNWKRHETTSIAVKVTPLLGFSYPAQLMMKNEVAKTCIKTITRRVFNQLKHRKEESMKSGKQGSEEEQTEHRSKRRKVENSDHDTSPSNPLEETSAEESVASADGAADNKTLLWCHPHVARGFNGCSVESPLSAPKILGYRNKCEFTIGRHDGPSGAVNIEVGFVNRVVANEPLIRSANGTAHVPLCMTEFCFALKKAVVGQHHVFPIYSRASQQGLWRVAVCRSSEHNKELMVVILTKDLATASLAVPEMNVEEYRSTLTRHIIDSLVYSNDADGCEKEARYDGYRITSLWLQERHENSDSFDDGQKTLLYGAPHLTCKLLDQLFNLTPGCFFQTNIQLTEMLYKKAYEYLGDDNYSALLDICSGTGTISICLYNFLKEKKNLVPPLIGVEIVPDAVTVACENAAANNIPLGVEGVRYIAGRAEVEIPRIVQEFDQADAGSASGTVRKKVAAIVDPPRPGLHPTVLNTLRNCDHIERIVYVSCNPETLASDVVALCVPTANAPRPFKPVRAVAADMFPHTYHVEMVLELVRTTDADFGPPPPAPL